jgi:hypothetical protein
LKSESPAAPHWVWQPYLVIRFGVPIIFLPLEGLRASFYCVRRSVDGCILCVFCMFEVPLQAHGTSFVLFFPLTAMALEGGGGGGGAGRGGGGGDFGGFGGLNLLKASRQGLVGVVKRHLDGLSPLDETNQPLFAAAVNGHAEVVKLLLAHPNTTSTLKALNASAKEGHVEVVELLLADHRTINTNFALGGAASGGHVELVKLLLADPRTTDTNGAVSSAASKGHIMELLLADPRTTRANKAVMSAGFGGPLGTSDAALGSASKGHLELSKLLLADHCTTGTSKALENSSLFGRKEVTDSDTELLLADHRTTDTSSIAPEASASEGHVELLFADPPKRAPRTMDISFLFADPRGEQAHRTAGTMGRVISRVASEVMVEVTGAGINFLCAAASEFPKPDGAAIGDACCQCQ